MYNVVKYTSLTAQYHAVLNHIVLYYTTLLYFTVLYCIVLYWVIPYCSISYFDVIYCVIPFCTLRFNQTFSNSNVLLLLLLGNCFTILAVSKIWNNELILMLKLYKQPYQQASRGRSWMPKNSSFSCDDVQVWFFGKFLTISFLENWRNLLKRHIFCN